MKKREGVHQAYSSEGSINRIDNFFGNLIKIMTEDGK